MFDGAAVIDAAHAIPDVAAKALIPAVEVPVQVRAADPSQDGGKKEVVFIDTSIVDHKVLEAAVQSGVEIEEISAGQSGLAQMAVWAETHSGYDSISVISSGAEGRIDLGNDVVTDASLTAPVTQAELAQIGSALKSGGDLLFYGSDIAKGTDGQQLISDIAAATGANVAASDSATGGAGTWSLNHQTGSIEATAFSSPDFVGELYLAPVLLRAADPSQDSGRTEIVFIDSNVTDWQTLANSVRSGVEIVLLDGTGDGLREMADYLAERSDIDAIHVVSHGSSGEAYLGTADLTSLDMPSYMGSLTAIGDAVKANGDVMFYGCDIAKGTAGQQFLNDLAAALHANVAASSDTTGPAADGGNWTLESQAGTVSTGVVFDPALIHTYGYDLAGTYTVTSGVNVDSAGTTTGLIGAGKLITFDAVTVTAATNTASLILRAYDVDYGLKDASGNPYAIGNANSEWDGVYIQKSGTATWQFVGYLTGSNNTWNYTTLDVSNFVKTNGPGGYIICVVPDDNGTQNRASNGGKWVVGVSSAQLVIDGGAHTATLSSPAETAAAVSVGVTAPAAGTYTVEYDLIDSTGHVVAMVSKTGALASGLQTVSATLAPNTNFYTSWSQIPSGTYKLQISLLDSSGTVQDTTTLPYTNVSAASVPATTGIAAVITGITTASWTGSTLADVQHLATQNQTPTITGTLSKVASTTATSYVDVYADGTYIGTASVAANAQTFQIALGQGSASINNSAASLTPGLHQLSAIYSNSAAAAPSISASYTEGGAAATLDSGLTITGTGSLKGAVVTIGSGIAGDTLAWTIPGGSSITASYSNGVLTLSGTDTIARYQSVLDSVTFSSSSIDPTNLGQSISRTVSWQVQDSNRNWSAAQTTKINITAVNSAPVLYGSGNGGGNTATFYKSLGAVAVNTSIAVSDDNSTLASATVQITGSYASGQDVLAFSNSNSKTYGNISAAWDATTGKLTLTSSGATATTAQWMAVLTAVTYNNTAVTPTTGTRTVAIQINDGQTASNTVTGSISVNTGAPSNLSPVLTGSGYVTNWSSGSNSSSVTADKNITITDNDNTSFKSATVKIVGGFNSAQDKLSLSTYGDSAKSYSDITSIYDSTSGILTLTVNGGGSASKTEFVAALNAVKYSNIASSNNLTLDTTNRVIAFQLNDGQNSNNLSNVVTSTVVIAKTYTNKTQSTNSSAANGVNVGTGATVTQTTAYSASAPIYSLLIDHASNITPVVAAIDGTAGLATTTDRVPTISGTSAPGVVVNIYYAGTTLLGQTTADTNGNWTFTVPSSSALPNALYNLTAKDTVNSNVSSVYGLTINNSAPTQTVTIVSISNDTGSSATDFITSATSQTINATLSSAITTGQKLMGSLDGGKTWVDVTTFVTGTSVAWAGATLKTGYSNPADYVLYSVQFKVTNASGDGLVASQEYLVDNALANPTITGSSFQTAATPTIIGTADPKGIISITWPGAGQSYTVTPDVNGNWSFTVPAPLANGTYTFTATETDPLTGLQAPVQPTTTLTIDTTLAYVNAPILISVDTGKTSTDYTTKTASQTISTSLNKALSVGQTLWASLDGGTTWTDVTSSINATDHVSVSWSNATLVNGTNIIEFQVRNVSTGSRGTLATQSYVLDTTAPVLPSGGAVIDTNSVVLTLNFTETGSGFDTAQVPSASNFTVKQNGSSVSMSGATVAIVDSDTVTITLSGVTANPTDTFTIGYSGTTLRDVAGNQVATFSNLSVINPLVATATADTVTAQRSGGLHYTTAGTDPTGNVLNNDTGSGTLTVAQAEAGSTIDTSAASVDPNTTSLSGATTITGTYGTLVIGADGSYKYTVNNASAAVKALTSAQSVNDTFSYQMVDGAGTTSNATLTVTVQGAADLPGPTLDASKSPAFTNEKLADNGVPTGAMGTLVSQLIDIGGSLSNMTDSYPTGSPYGMAITATNTTTGNGTWYYTIDGGATWTNVGTVSNTSALLLNADANTRLYYVGNGTYTGTISNAITFRTWDTGTGTAGTKVDTSVNGGVTAFSSATDTAALTVTPNPNVPPTWTNAGTTITVAANSSGNSLSTLLAVTDSDTGQTETWTQFSAPAHGTITLASGSASGASGGTGLLPTAALSYTPNTGYAGTDTFTVYETDGSVTISKTIAVTVTPAAPVITGLEAATDTGYRTNDARTNAATLKFDGTGAAYGAGSTDGSDVVVFLDTRSNLAGTAGGVPTGDVSGVIGANTSGAWTGVAVDTSSLADGTYYVYAYDRSLIGSVVGTVSNPTTVVIDRTAPTLSSSTPANNATNVALSTSTLTVTFNEVVEQGAGNFILHDVTTNTDVATIAATSGSIIGWDSTTLTITHGATLIGGHTYSVHVASTAVQDRAGNNFAGIGDDVTDRFTTVDTSPTYLAATTAFTVNENSTAFDLKPYLHVSDVDTAQTETWTVSTATNHSGTVSITSGTAASGSVDITPGGTITYTPNAGYYGTETFTVQVADGLGGTATRTFTFTVNAPATITATATANAYTEQAAAVAVDSGMVIGDLDGGSRTGNWSGGTLKAQITANSFSADTLALPTSNGGGIWYDTVANKLYNNSTQIGTGTAATSTGGTALTFNFLSSATTADVQAAARAITFADTNTDPTAATRTVTFTVADSGGVTASANRDIAFTLKNDDPSLNASATASPVSYTEKAAAATLFSGASISAVEAAQSIKAMTLTVGNLKDGANEVLVIDGISVSLTDQTSGTTSANSFTYSVSVIGSTATVTIGKTDTAGNWQTLVNGLGYKNTSTDPTTGDGTNRTVTLTSVQDSGGAAVGSDTTALSIAATVSVTPVNDAPTLTTTAANPTYTEKSAAVGLFGSTAASTVEAGQTITQLVVTVGGLSDGSSEVLVIDGNDVTLGSTHTVTTSANSGHSYSAAVSYNSGTATITLTNGGGNFTPAAIQTLVDGLTYKNSSSNPTTAGNRTVTLSTIKDSGSNSSPNSNSTTLSGLTSTVTVAAINDAPALTVPGTQTVTKTIPVTLSGSFALADVDDRGATEKITLSGDAGVQLHLGGTTTGVTVVSGDNTNTLVFTGTLTDLKTALDGLTYQTGLTAAGTEHLTITLNDQGNTGSGGALQDSKVVAINVVADQKPTITVPGAKSVAMANTDYGIAGVSVADTYSDTTVTATLTWANANATLAFAATGALTGYTNAGTMATLTGSLTAVNNALAGLTYNTTLTADDTITLTVNDGGTAGNYVGGDQTASASIGITSTGNDTPTVTVPTGRTLNNISLQSFANLISVADASSTVMTATISVSHGSLGISAPGSKTDAADYVLDLTNAAKAGGDSSVVITGVLADINATLTSLTYTSDGSAAAATAGSDTITISVNDNDNTRGGGTAKTGSNTIALTLTPNDIPVITVPGTGPTIGDTASHTISGLSVADTVSGASVTATVYVDHGTLAFTANGGSATIAGTGTSADKTTLSGSLADVNKALATLAYTTTDDGSDSTDTVHVDFTDGGSNLIGGAKTAVSQAITINLTANDAPSVKINGATLTAGNKGSVTVTDTTQQTIGGLSIADTYNTGALQVTVSDTAGNLHVTGSGAATISGNDSGSVLIAGTLTDVNAVLAGLKYTTTASADGSDTISVSVDDKATTLIGGKKTNSAPNVAAYDLTLTANVAPTVTLAGGTPAMAPNDNVATSVDGLSIADGNDGGGTMKLTLGASHGALHLSSATGVTIASGDNSGALVLTGTMANLNGALGSGKLLYTGTQYYKGSDTITVTADDQQSTLIGGKKTGSLGGGITLTVNHTDVVPTLANGAAATAGAGETAVAAGGTGMASQIIYDTVAHAVGLSSTEVVDSDNNSATVTANVSTDANGTLHVDATGGITITGSSNDSSAVTFTGSLAQVNAALAGLTYARSSNTAGIGTVHLQVTDTNNYTAGVTYGADIATIDARANDSPSLVNAPSSAIAVSDKSAHSVATLASTTIAVSDARNSGAISVTVSDGNGGLLGIDTTGVTVTGGANNSTSLTFSGTVTQVNAALASLTYTDTYNTVGVNSTDTITVHVNDGYTSGITGAKATSPDTTITVNLTANDKPVLSVASVASQSYGDTLQHAINGVTLSDSLSGTVTATVSDLYGNLNFTASGAATVLTNNTGSVSISGTTTDVDATLHSLKYTSTATASITDTVTITVNDGGANLIGGARTDQKTFNIALTQNDTPTIATPTLSPTYNDTAWHAISENGNTNIIIGDNNSGTITVVVSDLHGLLQMTATGGGVIDSGNSTSSVQIHGSRTAVNATLATLQYKTQVAATGTETISVTVDDGNTTAIGGAKTAATTFSIAMVGNDTPVVIAPSTSLLVGDNQATTVSGFSFTDTYVGNSLQATLSAQHGNLHLSASGSAVIGSNDTGSVTVTGSKADVNATLAHFTFQETGAVQGDTITVSVNDGNTAGVGGAKIGSAALTVAVAPNDKPILTPDTNKTFHSEVASNGIAGFSFTDTYVGSTVTATISDLSGHLTVGTSNVTVTGNGSNLATVTGSVSAVNAALRALTYGPAALGAGADTLTVTIDDTNANGIGGNLTVSASINITLLAPPNTPPTIPSASPPPVEAPKPPPPPLPSDALVTVIRTATPSTAETTASVVTQVQPATVGMGGLGASSGAGRTSAAGFQVALTSAPGGIDALTVNRSLGDTVISESSRISVTLPPDTFAHTNQNSVVSLIATRVDGTALPGWMTFDAKIGKFEGVPPAGFQGEIIIKVTARDGEGREAATVFKIVVGEAGQGRTVPAGQGLQQTPGERQGMLRPMGKPSLTQQLREQSHQGRIAKQMALFYEHKISRIAS